MVHEYLSKVDARSTTALYEGWLTGCKAIAAKEVGALKDMVSHCFLLTDGQANVGESDPEQIANKAAEVRRVTNISTSTFGIGDYEAGLLHPMAVAGGGHYHYLRAAGEIASAFNGSTLDLLKVAVPGAWLELEFGPGVTADVVSGSRHTGEGEPGSWKEWLGDLLGGDERRLVVRFSFPRGGIGGTQMVRARLHWQDAGAEQVGPWQELVFTYADGTACDAELARRDCEVMRWVGLHHADRARIEATTRFEKGDEQGAKEILRRVARRIREYAGDDPALLGKIKELEEDEYRLRDKNVRYTASRDLRGSRDHRAGPPATS
jgi:Ca-activated chloride channel family protein